MVHMRGKAKVFLNQAIMLSETSPLSYSIYVASKKLTLRVGWANILEPSSAAEEEHGQMTMEIVQSKNVWKECQNQNNLGNMVLMSLYKAHFFS